MLRRLNTFHEFLQAVEPLMDAQFEGLGIYPSSPCGIFDVDRVIDLLSFCTENPEYHIASVLSGLIYINTFVPSANMFYLAKGDSDPSISYIPRASLEAYLKFSAAKIWGRELRAETKKMRSMGIPKIFAK